MSQNAQRQDGEQPEEPADNNAAAEESEIRSPRAGVRSDDDAPTDGPVVADEE